MSDSPILCTIDLEAPGKQVGRLQVPRSSNASGWSNQYVPIVTVASGDGPTALVLGGVHGDEPEGQVAALNLARDLQPEHVNGRVIVIPCVSIDASRAYTRLWPSGANMNRSFPGSPTGPADEQLAHFLSTAALPALGHRRRHAQRRPHRPLPALVGDALGRRRRAAAADGRRDAPLEHRLVLRLHRHRRHRPARRRGRAAGEDRRQHRARRRRSRHGRDPPARAERAPERPPPLRRDRGRGGRRAPRSACPSRCC